MISSEVKKYFLWFLYLTLAIYLIKEAFGNGDFKVFLEAARLVSEGESPYNKWIFVSKGNYCFYYYSPLWAIVLIPFSYLPNFIPNTLWLFFNTFLLYRIWVLVRNYFDLIQISRKQATTILILSILVSLRFILYNFSMIQMTIFLLWGILESLKLANKERFLIAALLLAFVINIKIMPIVLLPYLIYRGHYKTFIYTLSFSFLFLLLPALILGWSTNYSLLLEWWNVINPSNSEHLFETGLGGHSLTSLIPPLLTKTEGVIDYRRNLLNLSIQNTIFLLNGFRLILISSTIFILKWPPFTKSKSKIQSIQEISFILLLIPLIFPHQQKYAFVLALPAQIYLLYFIIFNYHTRKNIMNRNRWTLLIISFSISFVLMTLTTDGLIGRELNNLTQHYKTITYGALVLLLSLFLASYKYFEKTKKLHLIE